MNNLNQIPIEKYKINKNLSIILINVTAQS